MTKVLIIYGTTDGHTGKIAAVLGQVLAQAGCQVDLINAANASPEVRPEAYDGVIVAASLHIGRYQRTVRRWVRSHAAGLRRTPSAFMSVCLAILEQGEGRREARELMERFLSEHHWQPGLTKIVAGAVLYTRYSWLTRWIMKRLVAKAGGDTDTTRDFDYTDWKAVHAFAETLVHRYGWATAGAPAGQPV